MGLSKGTLGLKFMNRQAPVAVPSPAASTPPSAPAAAASTTTPATSKPANTTASAATATATRKTDERTTKRNEWDSSSTGSRTSVVHETSLLSFPLLSTLNTNQSTNAGPSSSSSMTATYSSMPLTSAMVSGRRSFGGANVEIEKLNDPSSHQALPEGTADMSSSKKSTKTSKRPKKADRDAALVDSVRGGNNKSGSGSSLSTNKSGAKRLALDLDRRSSAGGGKEEDGANKKKRRKTDENGVTARWELDDDDDAAQGSSVGGDGERSITAAAAKSTTTTKKAAAEFARPAEFDGVKKKPGAKLAATGSEGKGEGKGKGRMMDDGQYQWAKQGETREWDAGKSSEEEEETDSGSDDDEEERMVSSSSDEESSEADEMDEAILADERRFSEAADRAAGGGGGGGGSHSRAGSRAGSQSKSKRGQGRR